ncbi:hypothetical protein HER32_12910 [Hymenobacter sp. BT18]|uniref:hypothetical protein n=1 Tax=Hymenobacter sp. BT18 TaxID=2835648 RepID=UPI00143E9009|nr:hypothetical protein [Hymenobacter sp. BT18]QIX62036.1 hypothetical protein HER32_12910 [Hymenobacter sp. BT18]
MSLKAYNPAWAYHEAMLHAAARWHRRGLLTPEQHQAIRARYPLEFYRPGLFLRIGLFIFTCIGAAGAAGLLALPLAEAMSSDFLLVLALLCALGGMVVLEVSIQSSRLYYAGPDNALLYSSLVWVTVFFIALAHDLVPVASRDFESLGNPYVLLVLGPLFTVFLLASIRYADRLVAGATYVLLLLLVVNALLQVPYGRAFLPFVLMLLAVGAHWLVRQFRKRPDYLYYQSCLTLLEVLVLLTFYGAGNYYVVREVNAALSGAFTSLQIPFALVFYVLTAVVPLAYTVVGLRRPSRLWLLTGLLTAACSVATLRYYHSLLPPELAAVLAGAVLLVLAAWAARYLRPARHGLTSLPDDEQPPHFNLESLVVAQTAVVPQAPQPGFEFGGGQFGGGGAESTY